MKKENLKLNDTIKIQIDKNCHFCKGTGNIENDINHDCDCQYISLKLGLCFCDCANDIIYTIVQVEKKIMIEMDSPAYGIHFYDCDNYDFSSFVRLKNRIENLVYTKKQAESIDYCLQEYKTYKNFITSEECYKIEQKIHNMQGT